MTQAFIEIEGLVKRFGPLTAVDGISMTVAKGEVLGFLGPNGAGKSTTMKMITGFLQPTEGSVRVCGRDIVEQTTLAQEMIGYLPEGAPAYGDMTPEGFLTFIAEVRGVAPGPALAEAAARAQLTRVMDQPIETLSKGFKRRVGLAQAILHNPPVLIMDEPTDGLDPNQKHAVRALIRDMAADKAIIISTHILEEVEAVCSRAVIIDRGRVVADGTPQDLTARSRHHNAVILDLDTDHAGAAVAALAGVSGVGEVAQAPLSPETMRLTLFPDTPEVRLIEKVSGVVAAQDWHVRALYADQGRLDEVFRELTTADAQGLSLETNGGEAA